MVLGEMHLAESSKRNSWPFTKASWYKCLVIQRAKLRQLEGQPCALALSNRMNDLNDYAYQVLICFYVQSKLNKEAEQIHGCTSRLTQN